MGDRLATVTFEAVTGFPDDNVVNTFAITHGAVDPDEAVGGNAIVNALAEFYSVAGPSGFSINQFLSPVLKRTADAAVVRIYDISDHLDGETNYGSPVYSDAFTLPAAAAADPLPDEVALCLTTMSGTRAAEPVEQPDGPDAGFEVDRPMQRHTGRIYVGPFNAGALSNPDGKPRPNVNLRTAILEAAQELHDDIDAIGANSSWGIWSRSDAIVRPVASVFVDNAFDIQRRRGTEATVRTTVVL